MNNIFFNIPFTCSKSTENVKELIENPILLNQGNYIRKCKDWFERNWSSYSAFMTTSCTRAMEIISLAINIEVGDEIILSPFTYVGVGNAFSNYGAKLVFVDIEKSTMNIDVELIEASISKRTKAIIAMHYAGFSCKMEKIRYLCDKYNILLIEDNAQGIQSSYNNQLLGSFGDFSCISFDMQKNISCNEGGVLLCKNKWLDAVDVVYNNGTNRTLFVKGIVQKYEWINRGSKFSMSEYTAAVLYPLLVKSESITKDRQKIWKSLFNNICNEKSLVRYVPENMLTFNHNAHIAYLKFDTIQQRDKVLRYLNNNGVQSAFHYTPLDVSIHGKNNALTHRVCPVSLNESDCLLRLPMHNYLTEDQQEFIVYNLIESLK